MGVPLVRSKERPQINDAWPDGVRDVLEKIRKHPSKASDSYYYKTYWQYFDDAIASLSSIFRVLEPSGDGVLVVQDSYYKYILIDLPKLYVEMAMAVGFSAEVLLDTPVKTVLSSIHPGSKVRDKSVGYKESVVLLRKAKNDN